MVALDHPHLEQTSPSLRPQRSPSERTLDTMWMLWIASLPLGHLTGAHNTLSVLVIGATLLATRGCGLTQIPALPWLVILVAWAALSLTWSALPSVSGGKLRSDLLLPVLSYVCAYLWTLRGGARPMFYGFALGLVILAIFSACDLAPQDVLAHWPFMDPPDPEGHRLVHWYPGVGDASGDAILVLAPLLVWRQLDGHWRDATSTLLALSAVLVILASKNRDAVLLFPLGLAMFALLWNYARPGMRVEKSSARVKLTAAAVSAVTLLSVALIVEQVSARRLAEVHLDAPLGHATLTLIDLDPRPGMWGEFIHLGMTHPWVGIGYGRTVPAEAYNISSDAIMIARHADRFEHAHNFFLNTWLQLGFIGLALLILVLAALATGAVKRLAGTTWQALGAVGTLTLLVTTLLRNSLDDFLIYSMASAFWIGLGALLALGREVQKPAPWSTQAVALGN